MRKTAQSAKSNWDKYCELGRDEEVARSARYQDAGTYANTIETLATTDEEWAEAFWNAWHSWISA